MHKKELLDFCRVKKIFDKGFGFLPSLYFDESVFFHFNNVKDKAVKEKLEKLNRSDVYFFFISVKHNGKRKVKELWLNVEDIPQSLLPDFIERLIKELNEGKTNVFEIAFAIKQLRGNNSISKESLREILNSKKILNSPSVLKAVLTDKEESESIQIEEIIDDFQSNKITSIEWTDKILDEMCR